MKAYVENFRGLQKAEIEIAPIALLAGKNGAGKSSLALAVAAAATGYAIPYAKLAKKDCGIMVKAGEKASQAILESATGSSTVSWPKADVVLSGNPVSISTIAAGLVDITIKKPEEIADYLTKALKALPTLEDLAAAFEALGLKKADAETEWVFIQKNGWDAAHTRAKEQGARLKGAWEQIAGERYGSDKAARWLPDGLPNGNLTQEELEDAVGEATVKVNDTIIKAAVSGAEREKLQEEADQIGDITKKVEIAKAELEELLEEQKKVHEEFANTPDPNQTESYECPHCEGAIHISTSGGIPASGKKFALTKVEAIDPKKLKALRTAHAKACGEKENVDGRVKVASDKVRWLEQDLVKAEAAKKKLETLGDEVAGDPAAAEAAKQELAKANAALASFKKWQEASAKAKQITQMVNFVELLAPDGIRQKKLTETLGAFNSVYLQPLCHGLGCKLIAVQPDMSLRMGATPFQMLSASEQFRVKTVLQVALAKLEKSAIVIIDGADILDQAGRGGLLNMLLEAEMPAIICMTVNGPDKVPNLAEAGCGVTYWIEKGMCAPVAAKVKEAA